MTHPTVFLRLGARRGATLLALLVLLAAALAASAPGTASAATNCKLSQKEQRNGLGPTYTTSLTVSGTSCANGKKVAKAFYKCRVAAGGKKGRCSKKVSGYRCSERRRAEIATQFSATASCKKSKATVKFAYTQYT